MQGKRALERERRERKTMTSDIVNALEITENPLDGRVPKPWSE